jgi:hypothetical protein
MSFFSQEKKKKASPELLSDEKVNLGSWKSSYCFFKLHYSSSQMNIFPSGSLFSLERFFFFLSTFSLAVGHFCGLFTLP